MGISHTRPSKRLGPGTEAAHFAAPASTVFRPADLLARAAARSYQANLVALGLGLDHPVLPHMQPRTVLELRQVQPTPSQAAKPWSSFVALPVDPFLDLPALVSCALLCQVAAQLASKAWPAAHTVVPQDQHPAAHSLLALRRS